MRLYYMTNVQSAQIQAVGASVQIGHRIAGVAPEWFFHDRRNGRPYRGCCRLIVLAPDYQCGSRTILEVTLGKRGFRWRSRGEVGNAHHMADEVGWRWFNRGKA